MITVKINTHPKSKSITFAQLPMGHLFCIGEFGDGSIVRQKIPTVDTDNYYNTLKHGVISANCNIVDSVKHCHTDKEFIVTPLVGVLEVYEKFDN